jgi:hypothetical protein
MNETQSQNGTGSGVEQQQSMVGSADIQARIGMYKIL